MKSHIYPTAKNAIFNVFNAPELRTVALNVFLDQIDIRLLAYALINTFNILTKKTVEPAIFNAPLAKIRPISAKRV